MHSTKNFKDNEAKMTELKGEIDKSTNIFEEYNTLSL